MSRRWAALLAGTVATAALAAGFGLAMDRVTSATAPAPRLQTVSDSALAGLGITLSAAAQPPYCGVQQAAVSRGWLHPGSAGCPIGPDLARAAAARADGGQVVESVLARVSWSRNAALRDRLAWLVVVRGGPALVPAMAIACFPPGGIGGPVAPCPLPAVMPDRVVVLDAWSGQILALLTPGFVVRPGLVVPPVGPALPNQAARQG